MKSPTHVSSLNKLYIFVH